MSAQSLTQRWLRDTSQSYNVPARVYADADAALARFSTLRPKSDVYTFDDGRTQLLLCVHGLLPITFRQASYNIPLAVWVPRDYPRAPPIAYVVPTADMLVKAGKHVDPSGRCTIDYTTNWQRKDEGCSLAALLEALQQHFSREPPVYAKPKDPYAGRPPPPLPPSTSTSSPPSALPPNPSEPPALPSKPAFLSPQPAPPPPIPAHQAPPFTQAPHPHPPATNPQYHAPAPPPRPQPASPPPRPPLPSAQFQYQQYAPPPHTQPQYAAPTYVGPPPATYRPNPSQVPNPNPNPSPNYIPPPPRAEPVHHPHAAPIPDLLDQDDLPGLSSASQHPNLPTPLSAPPRPPNPELARLQAAVHTKLTGELNALTQALAADAERLRAQQADLLAGEPAIRDEMARLEAVRDVCRGVAGRLRGAVGEAEGRLGEMRRKGDPGVDEVVCATSIVHNQLINLIADDNAIEDTIYHLHRALNAGRIDLERFLRSTRVLAEEQFMKRALIEKVQSSVAELAPTPASWA